MPSSAVLYIPLQTRIKFIQGISQSLQSLRILLRDQFARNLSRNRNSRWSTNSHEWSRRRNIECSWIRRSSFLKRTREPGIKCRLIVRETEIKCPDNGRRFTSLCVTEAGDGEGNQIWSIPRSFHDGIRERRGIPSVGRATRTTFGHFLSLHVDTRGSFAAVGVQ